MDSETAASLVTNAHLVTDIFGRWPSFHDSEVLYLAIDRDEQWLEIHVWVFEMSADVGEKGTFVLRNEHRVALRFNAIANLDISEFNQQNVLGSLTFKGRDEGFHVVARSLYGLGFTLDCGEIVVVGIEPYKKENPRRIAD